MESTHKVDRFNGVVVTTPETTYPLTLLKWNLTNGTFGKRPDRGNGPGINHKGVRRIRICTNALGQAGQK